NLVPRPAAGITAFLTFATRLLPRHPQWRPGGRRRSVSHAFRGPNPRAHYYRRRRAGIGSNGGEGRASRADAQGARGDPARGAGGPRRARRSSLARAARASRRLFSAVVCLLRTLGT